MSDPIAVAHPATAAKVLRQIARYGAEVIQTSLTDEPERRLRESLGA